VQRPAGLPVLIAVLLVASGARADDSDDAKALFERGRGLVKAGDNAGACPLFEQSLKLAPALGTKLNLAICWSEIGRLAEAEQLFQELIKETEEAHQPQRTQLARDGLDKLGPRVPRVKIDASNLPAATTIDVDGKLVDAGEPIAIDPGRHAIHGTHARSVELDVEEGELAEVKLDPIVHVPRPHQVWITGAVAGGALLVSAIAGIAVLDERGSALHHCATSITDGSLACDQRGLDLLDRAHTMAHVSTAFLVIGAGAAALTAVLELKWRRSNEDTTVMVIPGPHAVGVAVEGAW
jgi:hypothetical protein